MVEQDSEDDVLNCVEVVLRTRIGERVELPDFGTPDITFLQQPISLQAIEAAITAGEPRSTQMLEQAPDKIDQKVAYVRVNVSAREVT